MHHFVHEHAYDLRFSSLRSGSSGDVASWEMNFFLEIVAAVAAHEGNTIKVFQDEFDTADRWNWILDCFWNQDFEDRVN